VLECCGRGEWIRQNTLESRLDETDENGNTKLSWFFANVVGKEVKRIHLAQDNISGENFVIYVTNMWGI